MSRTLFLGRMGLVSGLVVATSQLAFHTAPQPVAPFGAGAVIEAALTGGDLALGTLQIANVDVQTAGAVMALPSGRPVSLADALGAPLPGRSAPGFVGTVVGADVSPSLLGAVGLNILFDPGHNVVVGPLTRNDPGTLVGDRDIAVMGLEIVAVNDPRLDPFEALVGPLPVDLSTVPLGSLVEIAGWPGEDGRFYATQIVAELGVPAGGTDPLIAIERGQCRLDKGRLEVRGAFSGTTGTVEILNDAGQVLAIGAIDPLDGTFGVRAEGVLCPGSVRARHQPTGTTSAPFALTVR